MITLWIWRLKGIIILHIVVDIVIVTERRIMLVRDASRGVAVLFNGGNGVITEAETAHLIVQLEMQLLVHGFKQNIIGRHGHVIIRGASKHVILAIISFFFLFLKLIHHVLLRFIFLFDLIDRHILRVLNNFSLLLFVIPFQLFHNLIFMMSAYLYSITL